MTTKAAFTPEEWTVVLEGPPTAGMIVITAAHTTGWSARRSPCRRPSPRRAPSMAKAAPR